MNEPGRRLIQEVKPMPKITGEQMVHLLRELREGYGLSCDLKNPSWVKEPARERILIIDAILAALERKWPSLSENQLDFIAHRLRQKSDRQDKEWKKAIAEEFKSIGVEVRDE